jgi:hypothetical protein
MATSVDLIIVEAKSSKAQKDQSVSGEFHPKILSIRAVKSTISAAEHRILVV